MAYVRLTLLKPPTSHRAAALEVLRQLDDVLAQEPGLVMSLVFQDEQYIGRVSVWETRVEPNEAARSDLVLSARAKIHDIPGEHLVELLAEADSGTWSPGALQLLAGILGWKT